MDRARVLQRAATRVVLGLGLASLGLAGCRESAGATVAVAAATARPTRPAAPRADESAVRLRAVSYLPDDYERIFPERVRLSHYGAVRYAVGEPNDAAGDGERSDPIDVGEAPSLVVVDRVGDRVRVIAPQDHYRLLLWLEAGDLYTVVSEMTPLAADGASGRPAPQSTTGAAVRLHPGVAVEVDGESGAMTHIRHRDQCVSFSGQVPRTALGKWFVPIETAERKVDTAVAGGTAVLDGVGGRQIARFLADCEVETTGPDRDGFLPILYRTAWLELRGWVAAGSGKAGNAAGGSGAFSYGLGHLGLWGSRTRVRLPEGTCLFAGRGGPAIGLITEETEAPLSPPLHGWWPVPLETGWGDLTVWVARDPSAPGERGGREPGDADGESSGDDSEAQLPSLRRCR